MTARHADLAMALPGCHAMILIHSEKPGLRVTRGTHQCTRRADLIRPAPTPSDQPGLA